jgi:polyisoprenoid-binding protein YceI
MKRLMFRSWARCALPAAALSVGMSSAMSAAAAPASYGADPAKSELAFTGMQAGAEFKARFHKFTANIEFAPDALGASSFDVVIDLNSVDSQDKDRDTTIRGPDIFDVAHWPTAHYVTRSFARTATGYAATGTLTLRGVTKDVPLDFQFTAAGTGAQLVGTAKLKRLDFGAGQGDWKSTQWIGDEVKVSFSLALAPKP